MVIDTLNDNEQAIKWAKDLLEKGHFCILDTETTGLDPTDEICQIGLIDSAGNPLLSTPVKPTVEIKPEASMIHGIYMEHLEFAPSFDDVFMGLLKAIGNRDLVIYNADFDLRLIRQSLKPYGIQIAFPTSDRRVCRIFTNGGSIHCAMLWYSQWVGDWNDYHKNYRWQKLPGGDHSAIGDCHATLGVIRKMAAAA